MSQFARQSGFGWSSDVLDVRVVARGGAKTRGDLVQFDLDWANKDAATTTATLGATTSVHVNVVTPTAAGIILHPMGICLEDIADDGYGWIRVKGTVEAKVEKSSGADNINTGAGCIGTTSGTLDNALTADARYLAMALGALSGTPAIAATMIPVYFDGTPGGLGTYVTGTGGGADA